MGSFSRVCRSCFLLLLLVALASYCGKAQERQSQIPAPEFFGDDYQYALQYMAVQAPIFINFAQAYPLHWLNGKVVFASAKHQAAFLAALVFPEVIRYSRFNDFVETTSLKVAYTRGGTAFANFSIGHFQQRPSFIEALERLCAAYIRTPYYSGVFHYGVSDVRAVRTERLTRLQQISWQVYYLQAAIQYGLLRFAKKKFTNKRELVQFFASYYNYGLRSSAGDVDAWSKVHAFPMGSSFGGNQYAYSELSAVFWEREAPGIFGFVQ